MGKIDFTKKLERAVRANKGKGGGIIRIESAIDGLLWEGACGKAVDGPILPSHTFEVASITKTFVAVAIQRLRERDREGLGLGLDEAFGGSLETLIPETFLPGGKFREFTRGLTLKLLLSHRSGLPHYWEDTPSFIREFDADSSRHWSSQEIIGHVAADFEAPLFPPGDRFHYSDTGYILLGVIISECTGKSFFDSIRELVIAPLGLSDTWFSFVESGSIGPLPTAHRYESGLDISVQVRQTADIHGSGGLISCAADLSIFIRALAECNLVSSVSLEEMKAWAPSGEEGLRYGLGLFCIDGSDTGIGDVWGHDGHGNSFCYFSDKHRVAVTGTLNQEEDQDWWDNLMEFVLTELDVELALKSVS